MRGIEGVEDGRSRRLPSPMLKTASLHLLILLGATLTALHAADTPAKLKAATPPEGQAMLAASQKRWIAQREYCSGADDVATCVNQVFERALSESVRPG